MVLKFRQIILCSSTQQIEHCTSLTVKMQLKTCVLVFKYTILQSFKLLRYIGKNQIGVQGRRVPKCASNLCQFTSNSPSCKQVKGHHLQLAFEAVMGRGQLSTEYQATVYERKIETLNGHTFKGNISGLTGFLTVKHTSNISIIFR